LTRISEGELAQRRDRLREHAPDGFVLFTPEAIRYFTDFWFLSNERPIVYAELPDGESFVFVPEFEVERTRAETTFARVESYPEYPGVEHPMQVLARLLDVRPRLGADNDGYPGILGYAGPSLTEATGADVTPLADAIESLLRIKSPAEIELIRESGRWCAHAHRLLQKYTRVRATEAEASLRASSEATLALLAEGEAGQLGSADGVQAGYRGQIGRRSSWAHAIAHNIEFAAGDLLVTETGAPIWGYNAELERGMVIGEPSDTVKWMFEHVVAAQQVAFDAFAPGATCADVDGAVMRYFEANELLPYWRQHTGHGIGLRNHEAPFLDIGDHTPLEPGMVFTIEPGVYDAAVGGLRHSDTVVVTGDGIEILTEYPRDLASLTLPDWRLL
jgi:Xaa-Pro aminopeptidase